MKAFVIGIGVMVAVAVGAFFVLEALPMGASDVYKTDNVRLG